MAQLGACLNGIQKVAGSNPAFSIMAFFTDKSKFTHKGRVYPSLDIIACVYLGNNKLSIIGEEFDGEVDLVTLEGWLLIPTDENGKAQYFAEIAFR